MNIVASPEDVGPKEENKAEQAKAEQAKAGQPKAEQAKADESKNSFARIQAFVGIAAITVGNVAAIVTHVEEIRKFVSQLLGTEFVYRFHEYLVLGASALLLFGYGSLTYWLYRSFVEHKGKLLQAGFFLAAFVAVGSTVVGTYEFLFRPIDPVPLVKEQLGRYVQTVLSQQVSSGEDAGGFRFSQTGISTDAQVWTTAQCLTALLVQDVSLIKDAGPALRRAFDYIERSRLKSSGSGWGYVKDMNWGVTEIDAWVALAYLYSLKADNAALIWKSNELADAVSKANLALDLIVERQHDDGGWSVIERTSNQKHLRTYSSIMAVWALAEAEQNGDVLSGHEEKYRSALTLGAKWILGSYSTSSTFSGWWPNPSNKVLVGEYPGMTAQTLFVLSRAKTSHSFIGADPKFKEALEAFIHLALEGNESGQSLISRKMAPNETAHDSDRYLEGRTETAEQSTFLWYPWTIAASVAFERDPILRDYQQMQFRKISSALLARIDDVNRFVRSDAAIYPTAEVLFASGYLVANSALSLPRTKS
jgi:hypothetical protein